MPGKKCTTPFLFSFFFFEIVKGTFLNIKKKKLYIILMIKGTKIFSCFFLYFLFLFYLFFVCFFFFQNGENLFFIILKSL